MTSKDTGRPAILDRGTKVLAPVGRKADGQWSGQRQIIAIFLEHAEAEAYAKTKETVGVPVTLRQAARSEDG